MNQINRKNNKNKRKWMQILAVVLALLFVFSSFQQLSQTAYAQEDVWTEEAATETTETTKEEDKYASLFEDVNLTGVWADDLVTIARTQKDYKESTDDVEITEDYAVKGFTIFGDWAGNPYMDWNSAFVGFSLIYAQIPDTAVPYNKDPSEWAEKLNEKGLLKAADDYTPKKGDLIFFKAKDEPVTEEDTDAVTKEDDTAESNPDESGPDDETPADPDVIEESVTPEIVTEPVVTEPEETEPIETEPEETEPVVTEPEETEYTDTEESIDTSTWTEPEEAAFENDAPAIEMEDDADPQDTAAPAEEVGMSGRAPASRSGMQALSPSAKVITRLLTAEDEQNKKEDELKESIKDFISVGIITKVDKKEGTITVIAGDMDDAVKEQTYKLTDETIAAYAKIPSNSKSGGYARSMKP